MTPKVTQEKILQRICPSSLVFTRPEEVEEGGKNSVWQDDEALLCLPPDHPMNTAATAKVAIMSMQCKVVNRLYKIVFS